MPDDSKEEIIELMTHAMFGDTLIEVKADMDDNRATVVKLYIDERLVACVFNRKKDG
jgi:hypothetical protein